METRNPPARETSGIDLIRTQTHCLVSEDLELRHAIETMERRLSDIRGRLDRLRPNGKGAK
ncbi:hypothetical protein [Bifidobacterium ruminantium]|uniref:hypothetical protein n=1 Tax=Bifidobacterium ruminantium TaxID=78346 RepID=UPI002492A311|nr:hypothetical protein [Bifidobacterium ruminantium]